MEEIYKMLEKSWSLETCFPSGQNLWTKENPSFGQCAITALILNDLFGGKIMRCMWGNNSHYYNFINDELVDFTKDQFIGETPDYKNGEERTREYLLSSEDTKKRYEILLKKVYENLCDYTFERINSDTRIDKNYLNTIAYFNTFEIDCFDSSKDYEDIQFDLAAQNTGNIFSYRYLKNTDEYIMIDNPMLYSANQRFCEIPKSQLEKIFKVGKDNEVNIKSITKLEKSRGSK